MIKLLHFPTDKWYVCFVNQSHINRYTLGVITAMNALDKVFTSDILMNVATSNQFISISPIACSVLVSRN